jgi:hypothetical protein
MKLLFDFFGMLLMGDGLLSALHPRRHCLLWEVGPQPCRELVDELVEHPQMTRAAGVAEFLVGFWLASRQEGWSPLS